MLSIVTPVLNEQDWILPYVTRLAALEGDYECIIVDGGSTDQTCAMVRAMRDSLTFPLRLLHTPPGRAVQMNAGAGAARGDILLFLHVDCRIPPDSLQAIERAVYRTGAAGGGFTHSFSPAGPLLSATSILGNLHARLTGVFFGDFGIFIRRDVFERIGGYDTDLPYLEDAELCRAALREGPLVALPRTIVSSSRRYAWKGRWRLTAVFALAILLNTIGVRPRRFVPYIAGTERRRHE